MAFHIRHLPIHFKLVALTILATVSANGTRAAVTISSKPTANMSCSAGVCSPTAAEAVLNVTDLAGMLAGGDVTVTSGSTAIDIEIEAALSWVSTSRLTLDSYHSINFEKPLTVAGTGALTITVNDGGTAGDFQFLKNGHVAFWDRHSSLIINGRTYFLYNTIKALARATQKQHNVGAYALAKSYDAARDGTYALSPISVLSGAFEGLGNTISNLSIDDSSSGGGTGLFGLVNSDGASIRDLGLISVNVRSNSLTVGSLAAGNGSLIIHCFATGQLTSIGVDRVVGGLVGGSGGQLLDSHADVAVTAGNDSMAGGLVGVNESDLDGVIDQSYATGAVSGGDGTMVGGLVGENLGATITNSYATGTAMGGGDASVGGLLGYDHPLSGSQAFVETSYSTGPVSGGSGSFVGGLIGNDGAGSIVSRNYWDLDASGISDPSKGAGNIANDPGITGLTTAQFQSGLPAGFHRTIWREKSSINNSLPYLAALPPG